MPDLILKSIDLLILLINFINYLIFFIISSHEGRPSDTLAPPFWLWGGPWQLPLPPICTPMLADQTYIYIYILRAFILFVLILRESSGCIFTSYIQIYAKINSDDMFEVKYFYKYFGLNANFSCCHILLTH